MLSRNWARAEMLVTSNRTPARVLRILGFVITDGFFVSMFACCVLRLASVQTPRRIRAHLPLLAYARDKKAGIHTEILVGAALLSRAAVPSGIFSRAQSSIQRLRPGSQSPLRRFCRVPFSKRRKEQAKLHIFRGLAKCVLLHFRLFFRISVLEIAKTTPSPRFLYIQGTLATFSPRHPGCKRFA